MGPSTRLRGKKREHEGLGTAVGITVLVSGHVLVYLDHKEWAATLTREREAADDGLSVSEQGRARPHVQFCQASGHAISLFSGARGGVDCRALRYYDS